MARRSAVAGSTVRVDLRKTLKDVPPVFEMDLFDIVLPIVVYTEGERLREQAYFWTPEWQEGEREADEDIRAGRVRRFSTAEELISDLRSEED